MEPERKPRRTGKARKPKSFDLFSLFTFLLPGPWGALLLTGAVMILQVLFGAGYVFLYVRGVISQESALLLTYATTFAVVLIPCASYSRAAIFRSGGGIALNSSHFGRSGAPVVLLLGAVGMIAASFAAEPLSMLVERIWPPSEGFRQSMELIGSGNVWLLGLQVCVLAPVFEELLCRGIILRGLLTRMRPGWAILLSAALFAVMHGNVWQGFGALVLGALLGYAYYRTGSLFLTMLMHAANNVFSLILLKTPAYASASSWTDILPAGAYAALLAGAALLVVLLVRLLSRIPREHPHGNLDQVSVDDLVAKP